jgi:hypothetical protein
VSRLHWKSLGPDGRIASIPDIDGCTSRIVVVRPDEPPFLHRITTPPEEPIRRFVVQCGGCGAEQVISLFEDGSWSVEKYEEAT